MPHFITRRQKLLETLMAHDDWCTATELASRLGVSDRTIRNEITAINEERQDLEEAILTKRGLGYMLAPAFREQLGRSVFSEDAAEQEDRYPAYVKLLLFLLDVDDFVNIDDISDQFYRSVTALRNDLKDIQAYLDRYKSKLRVVYHKNSVRIEGAEEDKRGVIKSIIDSTINFSHAVDLRSYTPFFAYEDLLYTQNMVQHMMKDHPEFRMTAIDGVFCVIRMIIAADRIQKGHALTLRKLEAPKISLPLNDTHRAAANQLWDQYETYWNITANEAERKSTMYSIAISCHPGTLDLARTPAQMPEHLDDYQACLMLVRCIIYDIRETYLLDLSQDTELLTELTSHIFKKLNRSCLSHSYDVNPFLADIKNSYPFVFEIATYVARCIEAYAQVVLNEDEVGFMAVHLCSSVERIKRHQRADNIYTVLFSHGNDSSTQFLLTKLQSFFSSKLYIDGPFPLSSWEEHMDLEPRLIFTTAINHPPTDIPVLVVNPFLSRSDIDTLQEHIQQIEKQNVVCSLRPFFHPELFFPHLGLKTPEKIIAFVSETLEKLGLVEPQFGELVLKREKVSSTAIQNHIAIPHPLAFCARETCIAVVTLPRAIDWYGRKAQALFFLAINEADRAHMQSMYNFIVNLSDSPALSQQLLKIDTFPQFEGFLEQKDLTS